jgi:hypothetical protein
MADPRLGPPVLTEHGVVFRARRLAFDRFAGFDARNDEFARTPSEPRRPPPVLRGGTVSFLPVPASPTHASRAGRAGLASLANTS